MKGLELAKAYYEQYGAPMLRQEFADHSGVIAAGLVGQGSECFGFDDEISRDHDFGAGFCLWIPERYYKELGPRLQEAYARLPQDTDSYLTAERGGRIGVHTMESFYQNLIGRRDAPETPMDWLRIPERFLATAVNGEVFSDPLGEFTAIRQKLQGFYPEDVVKKKLAANCAIMAQAGQYNYPRSLKRKHFGSAYLACGEFVKAALASLYLLNGQYMPFYKWMFKGTESFSFGRQCALDIQTLALMPELTAGPRKAQQIEQICVTIARELVRRGWTDDGDDFMQYHGENLMKSIRDPALRSMYIMAGGI